jgi:2-dehydro-3-deoxyphosphogluconate aldolase/(4S)-4-hydroxy-2-oxoglutarate aldolase
MPQIQMIPTGGVTLANVAGYLQAGAAAAGVGSELISPGDLTVGDFEGIAAAARRFAAVVREQHESARPPRVA